MKMLRLDDPVGIRKARQLLNDTGALFVSFAAQRTRIPLLIVHCPAVKHYGYASDFCYAGTGTGDHYHYVSYVEFGGAYPLMLGQLSWGYVGNKLGFRNDVDALNVTGFLNALGQNTVSELNKYIARLRTYAHDPAALDFDFYRSAGGPR